MALVTMTMVLALAQTAPVLPPPLSCAAAVATSNTTIIDGKTLRKASQVAALARKAKGTTLVIQGGDFSGQRFSGRGFGNVCFRDVRLLKTDWKGVKAPGVGFIDSDLNGARFDKAEMDHVLFRNTRMDDVSAVKARFSQGRLDGGWDAGLARLRLDDAVLTGFHFVCGSTARDGCGFDRAKMSFVRTDLSSASLASFTLWDVTTDSALLNETEIGLSHVMRFKSVSGPVTIREGRQAVRVSPGEYGAMRAALSAPDSAAEQCNAEPLSKARKVICEDGGGTLQRAERENARLYTTMAPIGGLTATQQAYLANLDECGTKDDDLIAECLNDLFESRRENLVAQLLAARPIEANASALFVSSEVPHLRAIIKEPTLTRLAPIIAGIAHSSMLVETDAKGQPTITALTLTPSGAQCMARRDGTQPRTVAARIWTTGADFQTIRARSRLRVPLPAETCAVGMGSGPLVRIPVQKADFDAMLAATRAAQ